ncbi:MAG TPA: efflux RND transporter permease subunit [Steroidobacteraceae bacterium]|jgi:multidrug efflux pump|nr:efflux RND transporter permease subunit [Steroidobacteraceae bacterium]
MSRFFIDRPIFAWVVAIIIMLFGLVAITRLPIARYPNIAPPSVAINASYPGASAQTVEDSVTQIIEQNMTGLDGLIYMVSTSDNNGNVSIQLTFASGTNPDIAQVQAQNKLQQAVPLLPQIVQLQGISVSKANNAFLLAVGFTSEDGKMSEGDIGDYLATNIVEPMSRVEGVGSVQLFGAKYAMRIWLDPGRLDTYHVTAGDVITAIQGQNAQVSVGQLGDLPAVPGQQLNATVTALGRMHSADEFANIVLRSNTDGSTLHLSDVARVELGQATYGFAARYNGKVASGMGITLATNANALRTVSNIQALLHRLEPTFPKGLNASIPYDTTPFVRKSIEEVVKTLAEAILLVFLVMFLFLQNLRATLIPTIAVPVVLLGTFAILRLAGYSINMLTMFAVVLAIGLLVDDAIVVVENVERLMTDEGLSPVEATRRSMDQITGALIGIATVLSAVFIPMAFLNGSSGVIYRQFSITIVSAMVLSVTVAIVVTPALCATLLKPVKKGEHHSDRGFFRWFNRVFDSGNRRYQGIVANIIGRPARFMLVYLALASIMGLLFIRLPTAYLPDEDQGYLFTLVQTPVGATLPRTVKALDQIRDYVLNHEKDAVDSIFTIAGFSFNGSGQNNGLGFILLKDWSERTSPQLSIRAIQGRAYGALSQISDAQAFAFAPPPITELGNSAGFDVYLKDDKGQGHAALIAARNQLLGMASKDKLLANVRPNGQEDAPQFRVDLDAQKAASLGLSMTDVNETLSVAWGGRYIDDFIDRGRVKHVIVQADAPYRMVPDDFNRWYVRNSAGNMVSAASFSNSHWTYGSPRLERYNGVAAVDINGEAAPGVSSGEAMKEMEKLVAQLPPGYSVDWTGESYQERAAGSQTPMLYTLSLIVVFLCLAALYESWSIPTAILLAVPLGVIGAVLATSFRGLERDIYFQVAMLTTIGLASKNAILIVEFAKEYVEAGRDVVDATLHAVHDRLRPILMTSLAFGLGVLPLAVATGAGAGAQRAIGTGVFGGMLAGTFLGIFFIPLFFVVVQRVFHSVPEVAPNAGGNAARPADERE